MEGITSFSWETLRTESHQLGEDGKEGQTFLAFTPSAFKGEVLNFELNLPKKSRVAVKTFKKTKSIKKIRKEAQYQQTAASLGAAPPIFGIHTQEKYIVMKCMDTLVAKEFKGQSMPGPLQYMICALMNRLDEAKVMQNDSNALNVMLDERGRPYMIDFGMAKQIPPAIVKKRKGHPNINITLWGLVRGFRHYKIDVDIMDACVKADDPASFIERGELELKTFEKKRKRQSSRVKSSRVKKRKR